VKGIADTGFVVAFANRNDQFHRWAVELAGELTEPLLTCEAVLAESAFHLRDAEVVLSLVRQGLLALAFDAGMNRLQLEALAKRYADRKPDLADLCIIRMSELHPDHKVLTVDRADFRIYRRNKREMIPLVCPQEVG
jgi:predicted nucleic acid-binding protein